MPNISQIDEACQILIAARDSTDYREIAIEALRAMMQGPIKSTLKKRLSEIVDELERMP